MGVNTPGRLFDAALRRARLARSRALFDRADFLHRRAAADLADRAVERSGVEATVCDFGGRLGLLRATLAERGWFEPGRRLVVAAADLGDADRTEADLVLDLEHPPFADGAFDLVLSALVLHWANDLVGALIRARQSLKPGGAMIAALLGGGTLGELRQALITAEAELTGGAGPRISPMLDPADAPALMRRAGFADPVVEVDRVKARYAHLGALMADLRAMGETNVLVEGSHRPLTRRLLTRTQTHYAELFAEADGRLPASFEIITLSGWVRRSVSPHSQSRSQATSGRSAGGMA